MAQRPHRRRQDLPCAREHATLRVVQPQTAMGEIKRPGRGSECRALQVGPCTVKWVWQSASTHQGAVTLPSLLGGSRRDSIRRRAADKASPEPCAVMSDDGEVGGSRRTLG